MVRGVVRGTLETALLLLPGTLPLQDQVHLVGQVQGAHRGAVLGLLLDDGGPVGGACLPDEDQVALQVHVLPLQAADLLPAHAQAARQLHRQLQNVALDLLVEELELLVVVEIGLGGAHPRGLHPLHGRGGDHVLPHRRAQGAGEQVVVAAHGVGGEAAGPLGLGVVLLDYHGSELSQGHITQSRVNVVVDDLLIGVHGGLRSIGPDNGIHPVLQPVGQIQLLGGGRLLRLLPLRPGVEGPEAVPGGRQSVEGAVPLEALPALIPPQFHAYIVELALIVIRNISFHCFSCHILFLLFLSLKIELANDAKKTA